ncbi:MAG: ZIP family metal transporter, partial [Clostridia bacterium]
SGVMLGIVFFDLLPRALEMSGLILAVIGVLTGSLFVFFISSAVDRKLQIYNDLNNKKNTSLITTGIVMLFSITMHNLPEGLVIGTSTYISTGVLTTILIGMHNIPEGMAISLPLVEGGSRKRKAVYLSFLSGVPTVIGALIGFALGSISTSIIAFCLSLASGAMICVVFSEMIPSAHELCGERDKVGTAALIFGVGLGMILVNLLN